MNKCKVIMLLTCLMAHPFMRAESMINEEYMRKFLEKVTLDAIDKGNQATYLMVQRCVEKTAYTCIGVAVALCGCWNSTLGAKRIFFEKNKLKSGISLTALGAAAVFIGLNITTINPY
jgi:hypothetical protein